MSNDNTNAGERPPRCRVFFKLLSAAVSKYKIAPPQPNSEVPASNETVDSPIERPCRTRNG